MEREDLQVLKPHALVCQDSPNLHLAFQWTTVSLSLSETWPLDDMLYCPTQRVYKLPSFCTVE